MVLTLYGGPRTGGKPASLVHVRKVIYYRLIELKYQEDENLKTEFHGINPFEKLPVLIDSNILMLNGNHYSFSKAGPFFYILRNNTAKISKQLRIKL